MRLAFHPEALTEYSEATLYYEERQAGLGADFVADIEATIERIIESPTRWRILEEDVRRCLVHVFPYGVLYSVEQDFVLIVAVMHCSREPGYWKDRLKK